MPNDNILSSIILALTLFAPPVKGSRCRQRGGGDTCCALAMDARLQRGQGRRRLLAVRARPALRLPRLPRARLRRHLRAAAPLAWRRGQDLRLRPRHPRDHRLRRHRHRPPGVGAHRHARQRPESDVGRAGHGRLPQGAGRLLEDHPLHRLRDPRAPGCCPVSLYQHCPRALRMVKSLLWPFALSI